MVVSIIAAHGINRELGRNNRLLWKIPHDLRRFNRTTRGRPIIMGRKTYESILVEHRGELLPERTHIVMTKKGFEHPKEVRTASCVEQALEIAGHWGGDPFVIGGEQTYRDALPFTDKLFMTLIQDQKEADTFFPPYDGLFKEVERGKPIVWGGLLYEFVNYER